MYPNFVIIRDEHLSGKRCNLWALTTIMEMSGNSATFREVSEKIFFEKVVVHCYLYFLGYTSV